MNKILPLIFVLSSSLSWADIIRSPIHSIDQGQSDSSMIRFQNGRVAFISSHEKLLTEQLQTAADQGDLIEVKIDKSQSLLSIQTIQDRSKSFQKMALREETVPITFEPTIIKSNAEANSIFSRLNPNWKRSSECSNRAHIWAHEEFTKHNIKTQKAFVFFTASYINRNHFKWWFHVAPMLTVNNGGKLEKKVLDVMFNHKPVTIKQWTDNFVFSKRPCKVTTKFSEYDVNPQTEDCYFITSPMYYWTPTDISNEERQNIYKNNFSQGEIKTAYGEAF